VLQSSLKDYFDDVIKKYSSITRYVWKHIQNTKMNRSKFNTHLQNKYNIDKRSANSIILTVQGRLTALKELKKLELNNLKNKIFSLNSELNSLTSEVEALKVKARVNLLNTKQLSSYSNKKKILWSKTQKLNRLKHKLIKLKKVIKNNNYSICWGGKSNFKKQHYLELNGFNSHKQWLNWFRKQRDKQINFIGCQSETKGNQNVQIQVNDVGYNMKIKKDKSLITNKDKYLYLKIPKFKHHNKKLLELIELDNKPLTYRLLRRGKKYYLQVIFEYLLNPLKENKNKIAYGAIGVDFNNGFLEVSETDYYGNMVSQKHLKLKYKGCSNKAKTEIREKVAKLVTYASSRCKGIVIEGLNFDKKKSQVKKRKYEKSYNKILHSLDYSRFIQTVENATYRHQVELVKVNPTYTSRNGFRKYADKMKLNVHQAASFYIARLGQNYERVILK
jgi:IS605 OrfB family transposase